MVKYLRVGLYARVSTHDQQTLPLQVEAMRTYVAQRGWTVVTDVRDVGSGATQRPQREHLLQAARRREIDAVLVWRLDRWGRAVADLMSTLQELQELDIGFVSLTEALDLATPTGRAMAGLLAVFAEFEREFSGSVCVRELPRHVNTRSRMADRRRRDAKPHRSVSCSRTVSASVRSPASWLSGERRFGGFLKADEGLHDRSASIWGST